MRRPAAEGKGRGAATDRRRAAARKQSPPERDVIADRLHGWWAQVIAGQLEHRHPVHGTALRLRFDRDVLVVSGVLEHRRELTELRRQLRELSAGTGTRVRIDVAVVGGDRAEEGLLDQTIVGVFETPARAEFARRLLDTHPLVRPRSMRILGSADVSSAAARRIIPREYRDQVRDALRKGNTLLVVTVDEVHAFRARDLIDEETRSLMTMTLPPVVAS
ncbi:MAG: hypothetical protein JOZ46_07360 [Candidatus Dormibacteraeota bacterium]|nr:hypothetical protein [Candidatus Dormibacteraeota bacterium]MBV9525615.1 hypothetical protein [Candidatus Dormibacteraeota bacterium]